MSSNMHGKRGRPKKTKVNEYDAQPAAVAVAKTVYSLETDINPCNKLQAVAYYLCDENNFCLAKFGIGHKFCKETKTGEESSDKATAVEWFQTSSDFTGKWEDLPKVIQILTDLYRSAPFDVK